jgi:nucleotide-binding universal stress UspA family protein
MHVSHSPEDSHSNMHKLYLEKTVEVIKNEISNCIDKPSRKTVTVEWATSVGDPAQEIVDFADEQNTNLIVMSTHGRTGIMRWALGSVADRVLRATKKPVALIRVRSADPKLIGKRLISKILLALDGSERSEIIIPYVQNLALKVKAEVILLHVLEPAYGCQKAGGFHYDIYSEKQKESMALFYKDYLNGIADRFRKTSIATKCQIMFGNAAEIIIDYADKVGADFTAMATHGRSGVSRWVMGSVTERVLRMGSTSLLLVRTARARTE